MKSVSNPGKDKIIKDIYYHDETGYKSINDTYKLAKEKNNQITLDYVKKWFSNQGPIQIQSSRIGKNKFNSYITKHPLEQIAVDLADYSKGKEFNDGYAYIFVAVDYFTKYMFVKPLVSKNAKELTQALLDMIKKYHSLTNHKIQAIVSDMEGGTQTPLFIKTLNENNIRHVILSTPNAIAERAILTIKTMIHKRIEGMKREEEKWIDLLDNVVNIYNTKNTHRTINMTPKDAIDPKNWLDVALQLRNKANFDKKYPELHKGDLVRTVVKKSSFTKSYHPKWSREIYKVLGTRVGINGAEEFLTSSPIKKLYLRHELLKVEDAQDKDS